MKIWKEEEEAELKILFEKGLSFSEIADQFKVSRSSIGGKMKRLGLKKIEKKKVEEKKKAKVIVVKAVAPPSFPVVPAPPPNSHSPISIYNLTRFTCRSPVEVDNQIMYCGKATQDHKSYCEYHYNIYVTRRP